jgi:hypothetical protein
MSIADELAAAARRKAQEAAGRTKAADAERLAQRDKERVADAAKTARLKELRLAKEAAEASTAQEAKKALKQAQKQLREARRKSEGGS